MMFDKQKLFIKNIACKIMPMVFAFFIAMPTTIDAAVVERGGAAAGSRQAVISTAVRPAVAGRVASVSAQAEIPAEVVPEIEVMVEEPEIIPQPIIPDKSGLFESIFSNGGMVANTSGTLAETIRQQRAAFEARDNVSAVQENVSRMTVGAVSNACDISMRDCMEKECGTDFAKCANDSDTVWGGKIESCRRNADCSMVEYTAIINEIRMDRDANAKYSGFKKVMDCGVDYNKCVIDECGQGFENCLSKSGGDRAISNCKLIADRCRTADSGLAVRAMQVMASIRVQVEKDVAVWENQLYAMRDEMARQCTMAGAMFDSQSLACVYTVEFMADTGNGLNLYASRNAHPGTSYDCTPEWFGVDITTFKENAYRLTRERAGASSAILGAGIGTAAGLLSSGAIDRAIDTNKAEKAVKAAEKASRPETEPETEPENKPEEK